MDGYLIALKNKTLVKGQESSQKPQIPCISILSCTRKTLNAIL